MNSIRHSLLLLHIVIIVVTLLSIILVDVDGTNDHQHVMYLHSNDIASQPYHHRSNREHGSSKSLKQIQHIMKNAIIYDNDDDDNDGHDNDDNDGNGNDDNDGNGNDDNDGNGNDDNDNLHQQQKEQQENQKKNKMIFIQKEKQMEKGENDITKNLENKLNQMKDLNNAKTMRHNDEYLLQQVTKQEYPKLYEITKMSEFAKEEVEPSIQRQQLATEFSGKWVNGNMFVLRNPMNHFSIYEPKFKCGNASTVRETSIEHKCHVATNAGFFNTHTFACLGNVISNGKVVQLSNAHNVNFGITKDGNFFVGYIDKEQIKKNEFEFKELVGGVVWLVRNGKNYVVESAKMEDMSTQETGSNFVTVNAGRVALGHTMDGKLLILQFDGDAPHGKGPNLYDMANMLIKLGAYNAINLDGGGSTTAIVNGELISYVSDSCPSDNDDAKYTQFSKCERKVTTITCIHDYGEHHHNDKVINEKNEQIKSLTDRSTRLLATSIVFGAGFSIVTILSFTLIILLCISIFCINSDNLYLMEDGAPQRKKIKKSGGKRFEELSFDDDDDEGEGDNSDGQDNEAEDLDIAIGEEDDDALEIQLQSVEKAALSAFVPKSQTSEENEKEEDKDHSVNREIQNP